MSSEAFALLPRWLIPVAPAAGVLTDHAVVVEDGRIAEVLPAEALDARWPGVEQRVLADHALIPGLINCHTHSAMSLFRGMADDLPLMDWLQNHIWPAEQQWVGRSFCRDGSELAIAEMIRGGTTCFNDLYFFSDTVAAVAIQAGIRAVVGIPIINVPTAWASTEDEYFHRGLEVHQSVKSEPLITTAFAPHAPYTVSDGGFRRIASLAEEMDVSVHLHLHETAGEVAESVRTCGLRPLARIESLGLVGPRLQAVHMTQLEDHELDLVARHGVHVFHCPESNLKLASGFCPVAELVRRGVNVCVGTDGAASNNDLDMLGEIRTAALLAKGVAGDPEVVPASLALEMATINPARALGLEDQVGSIEAGKQADLVAVNLNVIETAPVHHVVSQLVYAASRHQVEHVWVAGRQLLDQGRLTTLDETDILDRAARWRDRLTETA